MNLEGGGICPRLFLQMTERSEQKMVKSKEKE